MNSARTAVRDWRKPGSRARLLLHFALLLAGMPASAPAAPRLGANVDLAPLPKAERSALISRLVQVGVTSVRLPLDWNRVEPQPGKFAWAADDAAVDQACAAGLEVILTLGPAAVWSVDPALGIPGEEVRFSLPKSRAVWERYVRKAAARYRGRVKYWQVREQPNARNFRGSLSEYLDLLHAAARALRTVDPAAKILLPESVAFDPAGLEQRLRPPTGATWDIWGAYLPASEELARRALALSVLVTEAMPATGRRPIWIVGSEAALPADRWVQYYLLASFFGIARFFAPADMIHAEWASVLTRLDYVGFLRLGPEVWALVFRDQQGLAVAAWSEAEGEFPAAALAPGAAGAEQDGAPTLRLGPRPVLLRGLAVATRARPGPPTRADLLAAWPGPSPSALPAVSADYRRAGQPEQGLYNRALRTLPGGAVREEPHPVEIALGTNMRPLPAQAELDNPWIYFDVDDRWLYHAQGRVPVAITIEYEAARRGEQWIGFNLYYDSVTGYRSTPWHWVEPGEGWRTYRVALDDVSFTNRNGYDFRINAKGSRQDLWVKSVRVEKLPTPR